MPGVGPGDVALRGGRVTAARARPAAGCRRRRRAPAGTRLQSQSGLALIAVLWLTVLLTVIASGFAFSMRGEVLAARNAYSLAQARAAADGAVARMLFEVQRPRNLPDVWLADGSLHAWQDGDVAITASAVDESAKIDLNAATEPLLKGLLQNVGGLEPEAAQHLFEAIADWRDPDDLRRPNGAEAADYRAAGLKYGPANGQFAVVGELQRVLGMTPALFARIAESLTVHSRQPGINPATASRDVLLAIPGVSAEVVDAYIAQRQEALANKLAVPPFPAAGGLATRAAPVWRIRGQATTPDGVTFVREAVMRLTPDAKRPTLALLWQEGALFPPPQTDGSAKPADPAPNADGNRNR